MIIQGCGYGAGSLSKKKAKTIALLLREDLKMVMRETGADCVIGTGYSGLSMLYYLKCYTANDIPLIGVKKAESHGWWNVRLDTDQQNHDCQKFIFLDDFICSGKTEKTVVDRMMGYQEGYMNDYDEPRCRHVATVLYNELQERFEGGGVNLRRYEYNDSGIPRYCYRSI